MRVVTLVVLVALATRCATHGAAQQLPDSAGLVTFRVRPETVTVGQPFELRMTIVPPAGRIGIAPAVPDTGGIIEPLDPADVTRRGDTLRVRYRLLAWQTGVLTIPLGPVLMRRDSSDISVSGDMRVVVRSVLPSDSARRVPRDARALFATPVRWWERWWQWMLGALAIFTVLYLLNRWRTRPRAPRVVDETPMSRADAAFARLELRQLIAAGEGGRHVALAAEIVRQYLADIEPALALSLTNAELLAVAAPITAIPQRQLVQLLQQVDAVRFGGMRTTSATVQRVGGMARELVREIDRTRASAAPQAA